MASNTALAAEPVLLQAEPLLPAEATAKIPAARRAAWSRSL